MDRGAHAPLLVRRHAGAVARRRVVPDPAARGQRRPAARDDGELLHRDGAVGDRGRARPLRPHEPRSVRVVRRPVLPQPRRARRVRRLPRRVRRELGVPADERRPLDAVGGRRGAEPRVRPLHHAHRLLLVRLRLRQAPLARRARVPPEGGHVPALGARHQRERRRRRGLRAPAQGRRPRDPGLHRAHEHGALVPRAPDADLRVARGSRALGSRALAAQAPVVPRSGLLRVRVRVRLRAVPHRDAPRRPGAQRVRLVLRAPVRARRALRVRAGVRPRSRAWHSPPAGSRGGDRRRLRAARRRVPRAPPADLRHDRPDAPVDEPVDRSRDGGPRRAVLCLVPRGGAAVPRGRDGPVVARRFRARRDEDEVANEDARARRRRRERPSRRPRGLGDRREERRRRRAVRRRRPRRARPRTTRADASRTPIRRLPLFQSTRRRSCRQCLPT